MSASPRPLALIGGGGHAKVVIAVAEAAGFAVAAVADDQAAVWGKRLLGHEVRGPVAEVLAALPDVPGFLAIGDNGGRLRLDGAIAGRAWGVVIHPSAIVHGSASLGDGALVCTSVVVHPDARVGRHVILNTAAVIEHDAAIGDFVHVAPNVTLAGHVTIGEGAMVGAGSVVVPGRRIGAWSVVGAGTVVTTDVPAYTVSVGCPNRVIKELPRS